jgi:hypothetical protein
LWPTQRASIPPVILRLVDEIGDDVVLAEAVLSWVREKKTEIVGAKLNVLYSPGQIEAMVARLDQTE